ncbi:MAG: TolC family protein [Ignavibacterium sp.]|jgi:outer membrane protein TolC|nr:TolC family protein [Ignavibacterium sp.]
MNQLNFFSSIHLKKIIFLFSLIPFVVSAQPKIYTLDDAIGQALRNNKNINISQMNVEKAGATVKEAFGYALPKLDLSGNFSHFIKKPLMPFPDFEALLTNATYSILFDEGVIPRDDSKYLPMETKLQSFALTNAYTTDLTLTQTLFSSAVFEGIGASKIYYNLSTAELNNTVSKTVLDVQKAFYGVILSKAVLEIAKASFQNAQDNFNNVLALYKQGMVSEFDKLQAEVQVENLRPYVLQIENTLINTKNGLKILLGENQEQDIDVFAEIVYEPIDNIDETALIDEALENNFDITSLGLKKQVDEAFIELDVAEYWPNIAAFGNYSYAGTSDEWNFQNYSAFTVGLSFQMNLWQGNRTKNAVEQSTITYKQTEQQELLLKDAIRVAVKEKINELRRVQSLVEVQRGTVKLAERAYQIANVRYKEGAGSQLEIQDTDIALRNARLNLTQSVHSYIITKFELEQLLGRTSTDYLSVVNKQED